MIDRPLVHIFHSISHVRKKHKTNNKQRVTGYTIWWRAFSAFLPLLATLSKKFKFWGRCTRTTRGSKVARKALLESTCNLDALWLLSAQFLSAWNLPHYFIIFALSWLRRKSPSPQLCPDAQLACSPDNCFFWTACTVKNLAMSEASDRIFGSVEVRRLLDLPVLLLRWLRSVVWNDTVIDFTSSHTKNSSPFYQEYTAYCGGKRPIQKVLIANNGNAAIKGMTFAAFEMWK